MASRVVGTNKATATGEFMDVKEAERKRDELQKEILRLLRSYEDSTGLSVDSVELYHLKRIGYPEQVGHVKVHIKLQPFTWQATK